MEADTVDGRNVDRAADHFLHLLQLTVELIVEVKDLFCGFVEFLTLAREAKLLLATINNENVEMFLHRT